MTDQPIRVLLVDDDEDDYVITGDLLTEIKGKRFELEWVSRYDEALSVLERNQHDVYLVDYRLGQHNGLELVRHAVTNGCTAPVILLTGQGDQEIDLEAMKAGAADYLIKGQIEAPLLERSIRYAIKHAQTLEALRQSEEHFRRLVETAKVVPWEMELPTWRFSYIGPQVVALFGYPTELWYEAGFWVEHIHPQDREQVVSDWQQATTCGDDYEVEYRMVAADGRIVWQRDIVSVVRDESGSKMLRGFKFDLTAHKQMEEDLLKARKLESLGLLAGGLAHDFNNILTVISGTISLAQMFIDSNNQISENLAAAEHGCQRAKSLTQQLLTFSKGGAPVKKAASISELIRDSTDFVLSGADLRCEFTLPDDLWVVEVDVGQRVVEVDVGQMSQVIHNLILNARQSMPGGGVIKIQAENVTIGGQDKAGNGLIAATSALLSVPLQQVPTDGEYIRISIEDHGVGIPEELFDKIFDPYFTTKQDGNGLGLATAYAIIKKHSGYIIFTSGQGVGTTFFIYLPASPEAILPAKVEPEKPASSRPGRVLVMDDNIPIREFVNQAMPIIGFEVACAQDGAEAIELYKQARAAGQPFDIVIMDLTIPGGMGGKEAIQRLLEIDSDVKAIVSSGYSNEPVMADFRRYGFRGLLPKPYGIEELKQALHEVMNGTGIRDEDKQFLPS
jgi:PAS domain S-box-containing protein